MKIEYTELQGNGRWTPVVEGSSVLEFSLAMHYADEENRPWRLKVDGKVFTNAATLRIKKLTGD